MEQMDPGNKNQELQEQMEMTGRQELCLRTDACKEYSRKKQVPQEQEQMERRSGSARTRRNWNAGTDGNDGALQVMQEQVW
jgi:hypothetical protein